MLSLWYGQFALLVVVNVADRAGYPIRFGQFLKYGSAVVLASMVVCTAYMWFRYLS